MAEVQVMKSSVSVQQTHEMDICRYRYRNVAGECPRPAITRTTDHCFSTPALRPTLPAHNPRYTHIKPCTRTRARTRTTTTTTTMFRPALCLRLRPHNLPRLLPSTRILPPPCLLHTTAPAAKKASKPAKGDHHHVPTNEVPPPTGAFDFDTHFTDLESDLARVLEKLKDDLSKLRTSRVDPALYEGIQVPVDREGTKVSLRDIAHVVAKGRSVVVGVYEEDNVKKVIKALQQADLNVTPIVDAKTPTQLTMPLPPPTKESRVATVDAAAKAGERANNALRNARQGSHKKIKGLKGMRADDVRKADKQLEKIMDRVGAEAKKIIDAAKKSIMEA
ncbi:ribosome recycling factor-domain-containing protein [Morchella snyderi]|nr:ribosome recycling factor-domain-containing protein [Morchella snyderi]